ncbi:MAG: ribbon-helix-helix domain-containing protein [Alphaproteobacteria bacterium]|nr:ribbon-helix-helix domain-containing protein [Alphaproteobacteria bacterium]
MDDYPHRLKLTISGKTHTAMLTFLKKHGLDTNDLAHFIDDAITWRIMDREMTARRAAQALEDIAGEEPAENAESAEALTG